MCVCVCVCAWLMIFGRQESLILNVFYINHWAEGVEKQGRMRAVNTKARQDGCQRDWVDKNIEAENK